MTSVRWRAEAKSVTSTVGLDFRTELGQLLQGMSDQRVNHGLAIPDILQVRRQAKSVPDCVRSVLCLHWLFVLDNGIVSIEGP